MFHLPSKSIKLNQFTGIAYFIEFDLFQSVWKFYDFFQWFLPIIQVHEFSDGYNGQELCTKHKDVYKSEIESSPLIKKIKHD